MLTEQNDINLSIYDKTTNELKNTLYCITTMINDIKFENKLYNKTNDLVKMIKNLQNNSKDLSTNELKQLLKPVEDYTQQLSKELVLKEKEYDDKKEKDALQSMSNTLTIVLTTLHKLIHSSEFQDEKEKRGDKDARVMLKNATDNNIFPKEIKVLGKSVKRGLTPNGCFYVINDQQHNTFNFSGDFDETIIIIDITKKNDNYCDIKVWSEYLHYTAEANFNGVLLEKVDKILNNKVIPTAESIVKEIKKEELKYEKHK